MQTAHPLLKQISRYFKGCIELPKPTPGKKQFILCPISSGIDSTAVAIVMGLLFPELPIVYIHTDTGIEVSGTSDAIDKIERFTGKQVLRIKPPLSLLDYIEANGNYLPSQRQRFCTQVAKIKPYKALIKALELKHPDAEFISLVGIRADEPSREGMVWTEGNITSVFPLKMLGLDKQAVNRIVAESVGIPHYYAARSRSGCHTCFFMRRSEIVEMIHREVEGMRQAAKTECLPEDYKAIVCKMPKSVTERTGVARNWLKMAMPTELGGHKLQWHNERGVVRHGAGPERVIQTGIGPIEVRRQKVRDRATGLPVEAKIRFTSNILPKWARRSALRPWRRLRLAWAVSWGPCLRWKISALPNSMAKTRWYMKR